MAHLLKHLIWFTFLSVSSFPSYSLPNFIHLLVFSLCVMIMILVIVGVVFMHMSACVYVCVFMWPWAQRTTLGFISILTFHIVWFRFLGVCLLHMPGPQNHLSSPHRFIEVTDVCAASPSVMWVSMGIRTQVLHLYSMRFTHWAISESMAHSLT